MGNRSTNRSSAQLRVERTLTARENEGCAIKRALCRLKRKKGPWMGVVVDSPLGSVGLLDTTMNLQRDDAAQWRPRI